LTRDLADSQAGKFSVPDLCALDTILRNSVLPAIQISAIRGGLTRSPGVVGELMTTCDGYESELTPPESLTLN
jgi:hypothetical protein